MGNREWRYIIFIVLIIVVEILDLHGCPYIFLDQLAP